MTTTPFGERRLLDVMVERVLPNPQQPRQEFDEEALQELAASIREHGVIQPIEVEIAGGGYFILHHGERRLRAAKLAGVDASMRGVVAAKEGE